ncbi:MAG: hypothetical protein K0Q79_351 [Flavipsychrobacter sp.]|jgi:hypothetical protein|nr:hypothetical protein [Flavipsychrobacter sp.]
MRYSRSNSVVSREAIAVSRKYIALYLPIILLLFTGCKNYYHNLKPGTGDVKCIEKFTPQFTKVMYSAYVDVTKHHFSGILLFRLMPDHSTRIVFTNEVGVKFFDFGFGQDGTFTKFYVLDKLDKKIIVNALRNDLNLILLHPTLTNAKVLTDGTNNYITVPNKKGNDYYITNNSCTNLVRIEKASKRKPVVVAEMIDYNNSLPDSINISHKNFNFNIALKRTENN